MRGDRHETREIRRRRLDGHTGHCNNASFGAERYDRRSRFPLLYVSECRGGRACYVHDVTTEGSRLVQTIRYDGEECTGPMDWCVDAPARMIYIYCTIGKIRMFKRFRLPRPADSDARGEVRLPVGDVAIPQGSMIRGRLLYLPDGLPSRDRRLHIVDVVTARPVALVDLNSIEYEPEGLAAKGRRLYMSFHTTGDPRRNRIYRFDLR